MKQTIIKRKRDYAKNSISLLSLIALAYCAPKEDLNTYLEKQNSDSEIINGVPTNADESIAKSTVAIFKDDEFHCTGTIIKSDAILTAAHCIDDNTKKYKVKFATNVESGISQNLQIDAKKIMIHEGFTTDVFVEKEKHDIGLIILEKKIPEGFKPAKLLKSTQGRIINNNEVEIAGFGFTSVENILGKNFYIGGKTLMKTKIKVLDETFSKSEIRLDQSAGSGSGACRGDSGGPAFITINAQLYLWGVASRGAEGCKTDSIYTNATQYINWIKLQLQLAKRDSSQI